MTNGFGDVPVVSRYNYSAWRGFVIQTQHRLEQLPVLVRWLVVLILEGHEGNALSGLFNSILCWVCEKYGQVMCAWVAPTTKHNRDFFWQFRGDRSLHALYRQRHVIDKRVGVDERVSYMWEHFAALAKAERQVARDNEFLPAVDGRGGFFQSVSCAEDGTSQDDENDVTSRFSFS